MAAKNMLNAPFTTMMMLRFCCTFNWRALLLGTKFMRRDDGLDLFLGLTGNVRMVVQRAGNGGYGVPGFPCDVLDRQQLHPPFLKGCNRYRERSRKRFQILLLLIIHLRVRNLQEGFGNFGKLI